MEGMEFRAEAYMTVFMAARHLRGRGPGLSQQRIRLACQKGEILEARLLPITPDRAVYVFPAVRLLDWWARRGERRRPGRPRKSD